MEPSVECPRRTNPKSLVHICDFHKLKAMHRWSKSKKNGLSSAEQEIFLELMKSITYANTVDKFEKLGKNPGFTKTNQMFRAI